MSARVNCDRGRCIEIVLQCIYLFIIIILFYAVSGLRFWVIVFWVTVL